MNLNVENDSQKTTRNFLTYLVNMCKYFVITGIIKVQHLLESQLAVGTIGNKMGVLRTQKNNTLILLKTFIFIEKTKQ